jgi:triosephosphate isomerase
MRKLAAGNWKMNGTDDDLDEVRRLVHAFPGTRPVDIVVCPPATLLHRMSDICAGSAVQTGGQDCHAAAKGAHTGDISAEMLRDAGADFVILGHSERRTDHRETDLMVRAKFLAAIAERLVPIVCIGETLAEREAGRTIEVVGRQLEGSLPSNMPGDIDIGDVVIAYEPVWAIGTGLTATTAQIAEVHAFIRERLEDRFGKGGSAMRILYGGSVKPSNAGEIFAVPDVDGALVGGASLKAQDFGMIVMALSNA